MGQRRLQPKILCFLAAMTLPSTVHASDSPLDCASKVADEQGVTSYVSLIDGQPTDPNAPTANFGLSRADSVYTLQPSLQIAPGSRRGLCDAVLSLMLPPLQYSGNRVFIGQLAGLGWEQRWQEDTGSRPTIATLFSASFDWSGASMVANIEATLVAAKTVKETVYYVNASVAKSFGKGINTPYTPSLTVGAKWPAQSDNALVTDIVIARSAAPTIELGYQLNGPFDLDLGPGLSFTVEERPKIGIGIIIQREF